MASLAFCLCKDGLGGFGTAEYHSYPDCQQAAGDYRTGKPCGSRSNIHIAHRHGGWCFFYDDNAVHGITGCGAMNLAEIFVAARRRKGMGKSPSRPRIISKSSVISIHRVKALGIRPRYGIAFLNRNGSGVIGKVNDIYGGVAGCDNEMGGDIEKDTQKAEGK